MGARSRELILLLAVCALVCTEPTNKTVKKINNDNDLYQYEDYDNDDGVLFSEDKPCPRDCICTVSQGYRIAKCSRLEVGTQSFGDDITDLVIENADSRFPIILDDFIFKRLGLHQISTVKIVNNTIGSVSPKAFHGLSELYAVNLSGNRLKVLHSETFATNKKLLLLTLSNNQLKFPPAGSTNYFLNASSIQELDVSNCNMQYITADTFKNMPALMYLNVANNDLYELDRDAFKKLLDLEELDLSDNKLKTFPDEIFSANTELATLHVQKNPIDSVYGLQIPDLLTFNAGQTNIKFVGPSMFNGMKYIANLNLSGNGIEKIHNQAFHKLIELNYLDLSYNNLNFISNVLIKENVELEILKISNNPMLKHLPEQGFQCTAESFNIYLFDASNCGLEEIYDNSLNTLTALSQINLSSNKIKTLSPKVFSWSPKLIEINLAMNELTTLDNKMFAKNKELGKLNLQGNPIKFLSFELFASTPALTWIDLSHANLNAMWKENKNRPTDLLNNLSFMNISHNRISEVKRIDIDTFNKLKTLDINNNPLVCSHNFENLMTYVNNKTISPNTVSQSIANLARRDNDDTTSYSWEALTLKVCGSKPATAAPVSDEEIWERIDKDVDDNFDLKDTLDDAKIPDDNNLNIDQINKIDDDADEDKDDANEDENDEDDDDEDADYDDEMDLKVKLIEKPTKSIGEPMLPPLLKENVQIKVKLLDNDNLLDDLEQDVYIPASVLETEHGHYDYLWPILVTLLAVIVLLIVIAKAILMVCRRNRQVRYNSAIIAAMSNSARTKKDCGLVYQPLSEDVSGPATPKFPRYQPLPVTVQAANLSYESSTFHHNNIVPEAV